MRVASPIPKKRARIEIIPLIDIMFFLLASFMMVSLSQTHMKGIRVQLPSPVSTIQPPDLTVVRIQVASGNATYINRQYVADEQVLPTLFELHKANPDVKVSISADELALHGDVIILLDRVRSTGISKVGYQVQASSPVTAAPVPAAPPPPPPR